MELYIIRHAQSENNALMGNQDERVQDPKLTEVGLVQADYVAKHLATATNLEAVVKLPAGEATRAEYHKIHITHLYTSAMHRALQTAKPIAAALGIKAEVWLDIHEHGGIWLFRDGVMQGYGGLTRQQVMEEFPDYVLPPDVTDYGWWDPEDGQEELNLCHARAMRVAEMLHERAQSDEGTGDSVALVTHGTFIDSLLKALLGRLPASDYYHWHYNTGITRLDILQNGTTLIRYINRIGHLPPEMVT